MIRIKGFSNYHFCPRKLQVFRYKNGKYEPMPITGKIKKDLCVILHENGNPYLIRIIDIILENLPEITHFLGKNKIRNLDH